jgi:DNA-binding NarL/FixJ family response regulator
VLSRNRPTRAEIGVVITDRAARHFAAANAERPVWHTADAGLRGSGGGTVTTSSAVAVGSARPGPWIRVGLLSGYPLAVDLFKVALSAQPELRVVLSTTDIAHFRDRLPHVAPDVAIVDLRLGLHSVRELLSEDQISSGATAIIVLANTQSMVSVQGARDHGARGIVHRSTALTDLTRAIREVANGGEWFPADAELPPARHQVPSTRELQLLEALRDGSSNTEIAGRLGISTRTVESHLRRLFTRYGVASRAELLIFALRHEWIQLDKPS